jgi:hypothetical protein
LENESELPGALNPGSPQCKSDTEPTSRGKGESVLYMKTRLYVPAIFLGAALMCVPAPGFGQQADTTPAHTQDDGSKAKQDMHHAGQETKAAAHDTGNGVKHGTEKAYHSTKHGTKKAWHKTKSTTEGAVDGAKEGAKKPQ